MFLVLKKIIAAELVAELPVVVIHRFGHFLRVEIMAPVLMLVLQGEAGVGVLGRGVGGAEV